METVGRTRIFFSNCFLNSVKPLEFSPNLHTEHHPDEIRIGRNTFSNSPLELDFGLRFQGLLLLLRPFVLDVNRINLIFSHTLVLIVRDNRNKLIM